MICCLESTDSHVEDAPCFLLEVLSPSTEATDRGRKFDEYMSIPSLTQYVLVAQDEQRLTVFVRAETDWRVQSVTEGSVRVACLETDLSLEQIYAGVTLEPDATDPEPGRPPGSPRAEPTDP
jgi:Uma2 family endonuclease